MKPKPIYEYLILASRMVLEELGVDVSQDFSLNQEFTPANVDTSDVDCYRSYAFYTYDNVALARCIVIAELVPFGEATADLVMGEKATLRLTFYFLEGCQKAARPSIYYFQLIVGLTDNLKETARAAPRTLT